MDDRSVPYLLRADVVPVRTMCWGAQVFRVENPASTHMIRSIVLQYVEVFGNVRDAWVVANALLALEEIKREEVMNGAALVNP